MKRYISLLLAMVIGLSLAGCKPKETTKTEELQVSDIQSIVDTISNSSGYKASGTINLDGSSKAIAVTEGSKLMEVFSIGIPKYTENSEEESVATFEVLADLDGDKGKIKIDGTDSIEAYYDGDKGYINKEYVLSHLKADNIEDITEAAKEYKFIEMSQGDNKLSDILNITNLMVMNYGSDASVTKTTEKLESGEESITYNIKASANAISEAVNSSKYKDDTSINGKELAYEMIIVPVNGGYNVTVEASNGDASATKNIEVSILDGEITLPDSKNIAPEDILKAKEEEQVATKYLGEPDYIGEGFKEYTCDNGITFERNPYSNILIPLGRFQDITALKVKFDEYIKPIKQALINEAEFTEEPSTGKSDENAGLIAEILDKDIYEKYELACDHVGYQVVNYSLSTESSGKSIPDDFVTYSIERICKYTGVKLEAELIKEIANKCLEAGETSYLIRVGTSDDKYSVTLSVVDANTEGVDTTWSIQGSYSVE